MATEAFPGDARRKASKEGLVTGSIICGVDDSESAKGAARVARELSARLRLRLVFVRVVEEGTHEGRIAAIAERLHHLADGAPEVDRGAHWVVEVGHAADRLVAAAEKENAVLIVVGSTGPRSSLLGSISAELSRRAPCAVVVVPPGAGSIRLGSIDNRTKQDRGERAFAGGIVRFNLGGGGDPIVR
jgi:nucleotide-binding universal stress UspA family protein